MKMLFYFIFVMAVICSCQRQSIEKKKTLVVYFSHGGNTEYVARIIADFTAADIDSIVPVCPYAVNFTDIQSRCKEEIKSGLLPEITFSRKVSSYDTIFIGYPVWFGSLARPVASWLDEVDLSGKVVIPFCTFKTGGSYHSTQELKKMISKSAKITNTFGIRESRLSRTHREIALFLDSETVKKGMEITVLHRMTNMTKSKKAIFDSAAVNFDHELATPSFVASRKINGGVEYEYGYPTVHYTDGSRSETKVTIFDYDDAIPEIAQVETYKF